MNNSFVLSRKQIKQLFEIANHLEQIEFFEIEVNDSSGIGKTTIVHFDIFDTNDTSVNITDYENW